MNSRETVLVRISTSNIFKDITKKLFDNHIEFSASLCDNIIYTKNLIIKCVVIPIGGIQMEYVKGMRAVGCFGFDFEATSYITNSDNICKNDYLINYILERENSNEQ